MSKSPFKPFDTVTTADGHTAVITRQETPMRICTHRYLVEVTDRGGKRLTHFFRFNERAALEDARSWKQHGQAPHPASR